MSVEKVKLNLTKSIEEYNKKQTHDIAKVNWGLKLSDDKKLLKITDAKKNNEFLFSVKETKDNATVFNFPKDPKLATSTAEIALAACEAPIELDSENMHDLGEFAKAAKTLNKEIKFSEATMAYLNKNTNSLENTLYKDLKELFEKQKSSPGASPHVTP